MTRSERVRAACERFAEGPPDQESVETVDEGVEAALDAALADLGGLDGLADMVGSRLPLAAERVALRADRDRLREALREIAAGKRTRYDGMGANIDRLDRRGMRAFAAAALADSEAGTKC